MQFFDKLDVYGTEGSNLSYDLIDNSFGYKYI